jgi:membrane protease YdiL (CAAX protease family)
VIEEHPRRTTGSESHGTRTATVMSGRVVRPGDEVGVASFLAVAFGLAWLPFLAQSVGLGPVGPLMMPVAPAIACIVVRRWVTHEGFADAGLRPRLRHWPVYLLVLAWPVGAALCTTLVALALRAGSAHGLPLGAATPSWSMLAVWTGSSILVSPVVLGEELGWRGYLQLRLFPARPLAAALATGFVWGIWHYPLILSGGEPTDSVTLTLIALPISTMTFSVFLGWVRSVSGSVWATSVAHASNNVTNDSLQRMIFTGRRDGPLADDAILPSLIGEALIWGAIIGAHTLGGSRVGRDVDRRESEGQRPQAGRGNP